LIQGAAEKAEQGQALTVRIAVDQGFVLANVGIRDRARRGAELYAQVVTPEVFENLLEGEKVKDLIFDYRAADGAAELLAVKVLKRLAVRGIGGEAFEALEMEEAAADGIGARLGDVTLMTPPAVRPNSALAPVATT
jgi:hypothetical protein